MDNPQVALVVLVENSGEGSGVAAPIARDIWRYYFFDEMPAP
jgi:cell division protein FtsI/penicillin-binding protein 2